MKTLFVSILLFANCSFADVYLFPGQNQNVGGTQVYCIEKPVETVSYSCNCYLVCTGGKPSFNDTITLDKMTTESTAVQIEYEATRACERKFVNSCDDGLYNTYVSNCKKH